MAGLTAPKTIYGVHEIVLLSLTDFTPLKRFPIIGDLNLDFSASLTPLFGGSNRFAWEAEPQTIKTDVSITLKEYDKEFFNYFAGATTTTNAAEASGAVVAPVNRLGTSIVAATGVLNVVVKTANKTDLRSGFYIIKAASATTVDVYWANDDDLSGIVGTSAAISYVDDTLKITASPLTITLSGTTDIPNVGLSITGGGSAIAMTTGDTAYFEVRPVNLINEVITIGKSSTLIQKVAIVFAAQKKSSGEVFYGWAPKVQPSGITLPLKEMSWAQSQSKMMMLYDSNLDMVCKFSRSLRNLV